MDRGTGEARYAFSLREFSGSLGDLATFLPLAIGLIVVNGVNATALFLSAGLLYVGAGLYYGLPVPVQPLKATAAIAIATAASPGAIAAAALGMGILLGAAALFNLNDLFARMFTRPVVRGIQLGLAVLLARGGVAILTGAPGPGAGAMEGYPAAVAVPVGAGVAGIILLSRGDRAYPAALAVMVFGLFCGLVLAPSGPLPELSVGWARPGWGLPRGVDLYAAFVVLVLPQIPLTIANSLVATADAAGRYYGDRARRVTPRGLAATLGLANLFAGFIGGMPVCHGSGGLTAHYRFGARTGGANLFIGSLFLAVALLFGTSVPAIFRLLPAPVLGVLLIYVGIEHARLVRDVLPRRYELGIAAAMGLLTLGTGNLAVAFLAGIALDGIGDRLRRRWVCGERAASD